MDGPDGATAVVTGGSRGIGRAIAGRGSRVAVNYSSSEHPTAIEGAGVGSDGLRPSAQRCIEQSNPMGRPGTPADVADAVEFLAGPLAGYMSGQHLLLTGGAAA